MSPNGFAVLPPELVEKDIFGRVAPRDSAGLARCCRAWRGIVSAPRFARDCARYLSFRQDVLTLQQLDVELEIRAVPPRVYHQFAEADLVPEAAEALSALAAIVRRHQPAAHVYVDSHIALGPPPSVAVMITRRRALCVVQALNANGVAVDRERVTATGWGNHVTAGAGWRPTSDQSSSDSARSELFVELDGVSFPERPEHYVGLAPPAEHANSTPVNAFYFAAPDDAADTDSDADGPVPDSDSDAPVPSAKPRA